MSFEMSQEVLSQVGCYAVVQRVDIQAKLLIAFEDMALGGLMTRY